MGSVAQLSAIILLSQETVQPQPGTPVCCFACRCHLGFIFLPSVAFSGVFLFAQTLQYKLFILAGVNSSGSSLVPVHTERTVSTSQLCRARAAVSMQADNGNEQDFPCAQCSDWGWGQGDGALSTGLGLGVDTS